MCYLGPIRRKSLSVFFTNRFRSNSLIYLMHTCTSVHITSHLKLSKMKCPGVLKNIINSNEL
ncbi:unnamed protein product [Tenebrio molitor]|nr:unnamed protein product [Tenebrio molitor]